MSTQHTARSLYDDLGVAPDATEAEIRAAYRQRAKTAHPDTGGSREAFDRISLAHEVLTDATRRARYDADGTTGERRDTSEEEAMTVVAMIVAQAIGKARDPRIEPLMSYIDDIIRETREPGIAELLRLEKRARHWEKLEDRFKAKEEDAIGLDIVANVIQRQREENDRAIAEVKRKIGIVERAAEILQALVYEPDMPPAAAESEGLTVAKLMDMKRQMAGRARSHNLFNLGAFS